MSIPYSTQMAPPPEEFMPVAIESQQDTPAQEQQDVPAQQKKSGRKWPGLVFRLACTIGLFIFLFKSVSWSSLLQNIRHLDDGVLLVAVMVGVLGIIISSYQWQVLLDGEHI